MNNTYFASFPIVKKHDTQLNKISRIALLLSVLALIIALFFLVHYSFIYQIFIWSFVVLLVTWFIINMLKKNFITVGNLILNHESIIIEIGDTQKKIPLNQVNDVAVKYNGYEGESYKSYVIGTLNSKNGNHNYIIFSHLEDKYVYEFYISDSKPLFAILSKWKEEKINFKLTNEYNKEIKL